MSENKKMVEAITPINEDFAQWYTDICLKAELVDYSTVKGCTILRPYGYAIWENIMHLLDMRFKETGHEN
ncbi:MAG: proline--tRNA ligase, partial [Ruthenibacterium sp.]